MKFKFLYLLSFLFLLSCSENSEDLDSEDLSFNTFPQKWRLFQMTGNIPNSETNGDEMEYQEFYIFKPDNTFLKTRTSDQSESTADGSYEININDDRIAYLLAYSEESDLIGNCSGNKEEYLYLDSNETTLLSSWWNCDGPGLFYKQVSIE